MADVASHQTVRLSPGAHRDPEDGVCVLELASMLNDEPFGDRPRSVCPALREFLQGYNDGLPDDLRQQLFALAAEIVDTHGPPQVTAWRARLCLGWARSVAGIEGIDTRFSGPTLADCAAAGRYAAQVARANPWCHAQTVQFFAWLARARNPRAIPPVPLPPEPRRSRVRELADRLVARPRAATRDRVLA
jgi:hypothetical protein